VVLVLATTVQRFRLTLVPGPPSRPTAVLTLPPERGIDMVLRRRT
jgi:hypothetical protein